MYKWLKKYLWRDDHGTDIFSEPEMKNVHWLQNADMPVQNILHGAYKANLESCSLVGRKKDGSLYMATTHALRESTLYDLIKMVKETVD